MTQNSSFYAVCNVGGPISVRLDASSVEAAKAEFEAADKRAWIDGARTDAEDDLDICGDGMSESEFSDALQSAGAEIVSDLSPIHNYHSGTTAHLADGWTLWCTTDGLSPEDIR